MVPTTRASWFPMIAGPEVRSVKMGFKGEDSQFFRVHHQRGAEPYTFGREGRWAVEVDFRRNIIIRRQSLTPQGYTTPTHRQTSARTHSAISTLTATAHSRISTRSTHRRWSLQPTRTRQQRLLPSGGTAPISHPCRHWPRPTGPTMYSGTPHSTSLKGHDISPGPRNTDSKHPPRTPIHVPDIRGRALCSKCHGENGDAFHFSQ